MPTQINEADITVKQIKERLEQLGVEFDPTAKKAVLLQILNDAISDPSGDDEDEKSTPKAPEATKADEDEQDYEPFSKTGLRRARGRARDSFQLSQEIADVQDEKHEAKINELLAKPGYSWYLCQARTVLSDHRVCRRGYYYPVHKDEVARVGTYKQKTRKIDREGNPVYEIHPRFKKETPKQGFSERKEEEKEILNPNDFVG